MVLLCKSKIYKVECKQLKFYSVSLEVKIVLIAGGSGLIGTEIKNYLTNKKYEVRILSRKSTNEEKRIYNWDIEKKYIDPKALENVQTIINLTGSSIAGGRWTDKRKKELEDSRLKSTKLLVETINNGGTTITNYLQASAMGYYGDCGDQIIDENSPAGKDYMAQLCADWENESESLNKNTKRSIMRIGLYLSYEGGVLATLSKLASWHLASAFGNGKMWAKNK